MRVLYVLRIIFESLFPILSSKMALNGHKYHLIRKLGASFINSVRASNSFVLFVIRVDICEANSSSSVFNGFGSVTLSSLAHFVRARVANSLTVVFSRELLKASLNIGLIIKNCREMWAVKGVFFSSVMRTPFLLVSGQKLPILTGFAPLNQVVSI